MAMSGAAVSTLSFLMRSRTQDEGWGKLAKTAWWTHAGSILGIVLTLFYLIYTHDYRYHYVWEHSSNELPVYYMISCYWEGQEGSFLLWMFWHALLGSILMLKPNEWRDRLMFVVSSVQVILVSMILGAYFSPVVVKAFYTLCLVPTVWVLWRQPKRDPFTYIVTGLSAFAFLLVWAGQSGFWGTLKAQNLSFATIFQLLYVLGLCAFVLYYLYLLTQRKLSNPTVLWGGLTLFLGAGVLWLDPAAWKIGSTPFMLLRDALPNAPIFKSNPDFVPTNGTGLNPLLQNYWMVIHPPTLFLGFATTLIPFAYVIAGLMGGNYTGWIRPARPWLIFSVMILGIGIIMGGYWAYETLNFGGYWNWDPVENASFVPWLTGIASLHTLLIFQKNKTQLKTSMLLITGSFLLVLYATFLTRSGILGENSVHTFTDLGLSGQLLLLVLVYVFAVALTFYARWQEIPATEAQSKFWTAEFLLFLGAMVFVFAAAEITFSTSLPVFNKILGTKAAPPAHIQLFYYKWNVWFAVAFGVLSGLGQFFWWWKGEGKKISDAIFRPFLFAVLGALPIIVVLAYYERPFAFATQFQAALKEGGVGGFLEWLLFGNAEKFLLLAALFAVAANTDILIGILRKNKKGWKFMGGTLTHIGFALMLLGILFSSGYDKIVSKNLNPNELSGFQGDEQNDNVLLPYQTERQVPNWFVRYVGKVKAEAPLSNWQVIEQNQESFKLKFDDKKGETFALEMPVSVFRSKQHQDEGAEKHPLDMQYIQDFVTKNLDYLKPELINQRTKFQVAFRSMKNPDKQFTVIPESEVNQEMNSILSHPSRKIYWDKDLYVHVSSIPNPKDSIAAPKYYDITLGNGQSDTVGGFLVALQTVSDLSEQAKKTQANIALAVGANLAVSSLAQPDSVFEVQPVYLVGSDRNIGMIPAEVAALGLKIAFVKIEPEKGLMHLQLEHTPSDNDWIVIKAIEKPFINLLWLGTFVLSFGFFIAMLRRRQGI